MESLSSVFSIFILFHLQCVMTEQAEVVYQWKSLDYSWPNDTTKQQFITDKRFIAENNIITGVKVLDGSVYVTVPRWKPGIPSTLNKVINNQVDTDEHILEPYPNWKMQTVGDCDALQYVQSMEIDPNTGYMWIIDSGRIDRLTGQPRDLCQAKLVIYDIRNDQLVHVHRFPDNVVSRTSNFMNDIVLDYVNGAASFAYITDTSDARLYVYDFIRDRSYFFKHPSMGFEPGTEIIKIGNSFVTTRASIDGIAMSSDFRFLYFCALNGYTLYRVSTTILRDPSSVFSVENVGRKTDLSDGMVFTDKGLYYGGLTKNAVYKWSVGQDKINPFNQKLVISNNSSLRWVDTFAMDDRQNLWLVANSLDLFFTRRRNLTQTNMYIWKIPVGENGYLSGAVSRTKENISNGHTDNTGCDTVLVSLLVVLTMSFTNQ
ncbi:protein yellow-like [Ylistrum balloti]|uniref:protein yellow-like n=1 Tax=Ylistrum balloti TaxID=509963 RepID=UPI002905D381|nr:protein yellow-like [Ylistrum balloti]